MCMTNIYLENTLHGNLDVYFNSILLINFLLDVFSSLNISTFFTFSASFQYMVVHVCLYSIFLQN